MRGLNQRGRGRVQAEKRMLELNTKGKLEVNSRQMAKRQLELCKRWWIRDAVREGVR